jgi:translation initiation factor 2 subunit 3
VKRGISIRLGYADATFYRCENHSVQFPLSMHRDMRRSWQRCCLVRH